MGSNKFCSICGDPIEGWGHNAFPVKEEKACDACNAEVVLPARLMLIVAWRHDG
tara:strand:- start:226 stop:387 length:162 start_codon:yes stop_codon:yes gene_type:complete